VKRIGMAHVVVIDFGADDRRMVREPPEYPYADRGPRTAMRRIERPWRRMRRSIVAGASLF
jgi:hypothetical protein